ncbi:MAG: glutathione S-transferase family protein [Candidatus Eremiobacteraeota bacterium]|nr:glutathione S-transferase family protein [Candidatus Eremiobacteraeota bacterium]
MLKLYGQAPTRVLRVHWLLNALGLEYEEVPVNFFEGEHQKPEFLRLNPAGKVPVLVDGDTVLTESSAIQLYLAEKFPQAGLIPQSLAERGQMYQWIFFLVSEIEQPLWRIARNTSQLYPEHEHQPLDVQIATRECRAMLAVLEKHMEGREYLVGERVSVADMNAAYTLDWAGEAKMLDDAPHLRAFLQRMYARPEAPVTIAEAFAALES